MDGVWEGFLEEMVSLYTSSLPGPPHVPSSMEPGAAPWHDALAGVGIFPSVPQSQQSSTEDTMGHPAWMKGGHQAWSLLL